jgi:Fe-Mn family superoxide dismutase
MRYTLKAIYCRPWTLSGLSLNLIESHYENNYGGALRRLNAITEQLEKLDWANTPGYVVNGLKREELVALNSTLLHELYFASLGGEGKPSATFAEALARDFGSVDRWRAEFKAMCNALGGGSGWVVLTYLPRDGRLMNQYAADHTQSVAGGIPILACDMFEHAYHIDFGANAKAYVDAFLRNVDFKAVEARYDIARKVEPPPQLVQAEFGDLPGINPEEIWAMAEAGQNVQLVDARPAHYLSRRGDLIADAPWRDPEHMDEWLPQLSKSEPVAVFCAYGFHVACRTAKALREQGFDAKVVRGGHSGWKAAGGKVRPLG